MFGTYFITIYLTNKTMITYQKELSYDQYWSLIEGYQKAKDDELVLYEDGEDNEYLIPKKNILFILIGE